MIHLKKLSFLGTTSYIYTIKVTRISSPYCIFNEYKVASKTLAVNKLLLSTLLPLYDEQLMVSPAYS